MDGVTSVTVERVEGREREAVRDVLAVEEPLLIELAHDRDGGRVTESVAVTMRTPGHDVELALGFLYTEGILATADEASVPDGASPAPGERLANTVRVEARPGVPIDLRRLERHFYTTSSCGVCGKTSIEALQATARFPIPPARPMVDAALVHRLPRLLREAQAVFDRTGGLHASALFDAEGRLQVLREDVGRHNALDKVIGAELLAGRLPAHDRILLVSGRASFELVQKTVMAGIPVLAAVGAPSSLAVQLAADAGLTLLGFVRDGRFNIYAGSERVRGGWRDAQPAPVALGVA